jgi:4-amino-4-deoxy-L-arabinose transferase-like glycosyltransferase
MVILLLIFILFLYAYNLAGWLIHDDEGGYLYQAWRMSEGGVPYRDFYSPKEPLFLFTGFVIFKFLGPGIFWIRMFSVFVTIFTSYLIFLIGKRIYNSNKIAVISLIAYLALPVVVFQARFYRPDAYVVFFSTLALFLFIKAWQDNKRAFFIYSGVFYAVALGYKLSGILGLIASIVFILYQAMQEKRISINARSLFPFIGGFLGALVLFLIAIQYTAPSFLSCVIGHQAKQLLLTQPHLSKLMFENIKEFLMINPERQYGFRNAHPW